MLTKTASFVLKYIFIPPLFQSVWYWRGHCTARNDISIVPYLGKWRKSCPL